MKIHIFNGVTTISTGDATGGKKNKNGYAGVHFDKRSQKFRAEINHKKKKYHLGYALTAEEATVLRKEAEVHVKAGDFIEWYINTRKAGKNAKRN